MSGVIAVLLSIAVIALVLLPVRGSAHGDGPLAAPGWSEEDVERYLASTYCPVCGTARSVEGGYCGECGAAVPWGGDIP